ncbi:MAG: hypothetical protein H0V01_01765 [Bacteroidetes bacterium]|nr:hypothetical protein [Bacteroidota bacterium]HET6243269.1 hypothetical protein [Bacteroidia bacterium]
MKPYRKILVLLCILNAGIGGYAQTGNNLREKHLIPSITDTIKLDSLSIISGSEIIYLSDGTIADSLFYGIDYFSASLYFKQEYSDTIKLLYRVFPYDFKKTFQNKDFGKLEPDETGAINPFSYIYDEHNNENDIFKLEGLNKNGSISRGVTMGNNQDLAVNSNMNLQLSGKINEEVSILAAITDNNIPIQPDGNTQQLQDFDQVYIQVFNERTKLTAGDFQLIRPPGYFMNYYKRAQGGHFSTSVDTGKEKKGIYKISAAAAVSRGKFARNQITGIEGIQGPYRLKGNENETFIIALSGTENVFIDGQLLKRGQEYDYIIDYNTAEITFTANKLITKDKRIVVEFQYSDRNYARSLFFVGNEFETDRLKARLNIYSEQDAKNQPLMQELDPQKQQLMASIGDSIHKALYTNVDSVGFTPDQILYQLKDSLVQGAFFDSVFVYSTNPENAFYRLGFSIVGQGMGNYVQKSSTANGKVFEWIAPVNGIRQGSYEPITILVTPKKTQMITFGGEYKITKNTLGNFEIAVSNNDINTFSSYDTQDNTDLAFRVGIINNKPLNPLSEKGWTLSTLANYEQVNANFTRIERFRPVEFERDWNILNQSFNESQHISTAGVGLGKKNVGSFNYQLSSFNTKSEYTALKNILNADFTHRNYAFNLAGSYLMTEGFKSSSEFFRHRASIEKRMKYITVGLWEDYESNLIKPIEAETLLVSSYQYFEWETFISNADTAVNKYTLRYRQRIDQVPFENTLNRSTFGESITFDFGLNKNPNSTLRGSSTYRKLSITNENLTTAKPEETVLGRLEYSLRLLKGSITSTTFYEVGSGLEVKKEFSFIEVPAGQGVYAYIGDLNYNGVKDLDEFEMAPLPDLARYIKIFTPTNEFVRVYSNQFNEVLNVNPASIWNNKKGLRKQAAKFSNQTAYRIDRRTGTDNAISSFNPFFNEVQDTMLITLNSSVRNTVFFNRTDPKFGIEYNWQDNRNKNILVNGFDSRTNIFNSLRSRWNITRIYALNMAATKGTKTSRSEFLSNRNFVINYIEMEPRFVFQPNTNLRISIIYKYMEKKNLPDLGGERAITHNMGSEIKYSVLTKGNLLVNANYIINEFNASDNTLLSFEMLEGLQIGQNVTWSISYQRNLSVNMQLSLTYTGRTSEAIRTIHTGGVQVRAFF